MKKYLLTLILGIVLLGLTGCQFNMTISEKTEVDAEEFGEFLEDLSDNEDFLQEFSCEFDYKYESVEYGSEGKETRKISIKGSLDMSEDEYNIAYKGTDKEVYYDMVSGKKVKFTESIKEEAVNLIDKENYEDSESYYKGTYKLTSKYENESEKYKSMDEGDSYLSSKVSSIISNIFNLPNLNSSDYKFYIDGNKGCMVANSYELKSITTFIIDGDELKGLKIEYQSGDTKYSITYEFKEIKEIKKPKDSGSYKKVDD